MGWDISYHPISENQINKWYFEVLENESLVEELANKIEMDPFYVNKYKEVIAIGKQVKKDEDFDTTHGYYIAVIQGFFQTFFYTRGAALSFAESAILKPYFKKWQTIANGIIESEKINNAITTNYCSGVFIPYNKVLQLLNDYENNKEIKAVIDDLFSHQRIKVFLKALYFAKEKELGILEATEVMVPNPLDLNKSDCYSNLYNCDTEGPILYQEAAMEMLEEVENVENLNKGEIANNADFKIITTEKKGFWSRLFGK